jgi:addiction module HigA family antidote
MTEERLAPVHLGEVLLEEFLKPLSRSQNRLGLSLGVHPRRINEIVLRKRRVTAETALRLARYFGTTPQFWLACKPTTTSTWPPTTSVSVWSARSRCVPRRADQYGGEASARQTQAGEGGFRWMALA